jgi:hypothetical protein
VSVPKKDDLAGIKKLTIFPDLTIRTLPPGPGSGPAFAPHRRLRILSLKETAMSDESIAPSEEPVSRAELEALQEQLKTIRADRDRQNFERAEIVAKANAYSRERDELKEKLAAAVAERDRLAQEKASATALVQGLTHRADEAGRRADEAAEEIARLRAVIDNAPSADPAALLAALAAEKTKAGVAWTRSKIPADSPALPWFDKTVEAVTKAGCMALKLTREFIAWATPRVIELSKQGAAKVEELLAKK